MIALMQCPICDSNLKLDVSVKIRARLHVDEEGRAYEKRELTGVKIKNIEPMENNWRIIIERIHPYIRPGLTMDGLAKILNEEYNICIVHTPVLIEKIKEAYGLYVKDGKTLEKI